MKKMGPIPLYSNIKVLPFFAGDVIWCHSHCCSDRQYSRFYPIPKEAAINHPPTPSRLLFIASNTLLEPNQANNEHLDVHHCIKYYIKCQTRYLWGEENWLGVCALSFWGRGVWVWLMLCLSGETGSALQTAIRWRLFFGFSFRELWCLPTT